MSVKEAVLGAAARAKALIDLLFLHISQWTREEANKYLEELDSIIQEANEDEREEIGEYFEQEKKKWETKH